MHPLKARARAAPRLEVAQVTLVGQLALVLGFALSIVVQYRFYITRDRSPLTYASLAAANFLLLVAARALTIVLPGFIMVLLWAGFLFGLGLAIFHEHLQLEES